MNLSRLCIERPVGTTLAMMGLALSGVLALKTLPVSALPQVDFPTIVVTTLLPGASAQTMAATVTTPLERQLGQVPALRQLGSTSSPSVSQITLQFTLDRKIDAAEQDVQAAINAATNLLPKALPSPPTYAKSNPADAPIMTLSAQSDSLAIAQVDDFADSVLAQKLSQISGVGLVRLGGGQKPAVRVSVDLQALASMGLSIEDIRNALLNNNVNAPKGNLEGERLAWSIAADDQLFDAKSFAQLVVAYRGDGPVYLSAVADVFDGVENNQLAAFHNGKRAIILDVHRQPGANVVAVADAIRTLLPSLEASAPKGLTLDVIADRTTTTEASLRDVQNTLLMTIILVIGVIYLFLRDWRATLIPGVAVPLSLLGTFALMYLLNFSLNNLTLMALTISTGFVVDDAIVMVENIARYLEMGHTPIEAAIRGAEEIGFTIVSLTVSLVAVLIPLLFMGGVLGRLFYEFSITLSSAIIVSALLSLTLTPMMCALMLKTEVPQKTSARRKRHNTHTLGQFLTTAYTKSLKVSLCHQRKVLLVALLTTVATAALFWHIPKGFFPSVDTGLLTGISEADPDISFMAMAERQQKLALVLSGDEDVAHVAVFVGSDGINLTPNTARLQVALKPQALRSASLATIVQRLLVTAHADGGIRLYLQNIQDLQLDSRLSRTQFQYTLEDADETELAQWVPKIEAAMQGNPALKDVTSDLGAQGLVAFIDIDRDAMGRLAINTQSIDDVLYDAFGQRFVSTIFTQLNQYRVILEAQTPFASGPEMLKELYVPSAQNQLVPLMAVAGVNHQRRPLAISHQGQFPAATLSFNLAPNASLGQATQSILAMERALVLPRGLRANFSGAASAFSESLAQEPLLILAAVVVVYAVLGILYESFVHPLTIISTLPSAGIGALLALYGSGQDFSVIALIGIILLIGIVKKNAIMMIDFALEKERHPVQGVVLTPSAAIYQAASLRFRPIMMTTLAALLGGVPLAFGRGDGAELRQPLGITIVGGLILSQVLTLYTTPSIYLFLSRVTRRAKQLLEHKTDPVATPSSPQ